MSSITARFVLLIATAAVAPLLIYGMVSLRGVSEGTQNSVQEGHLRIATQAAGQLKLYIDNNARILRSLGQELTETNLAPWQQSRILKNHVLEFPEFREISLFDASERPIATSRLGAPRTVVPETPGRMTEGVGVAAIFQDDDLLPATNLTVRIVSGTEPVGYLVARISLEELWRLVDGIRVGQQGYALVFAEDDQLVAHGNPDRKRLVAASPESVRALPSAGLLAELDADTPTVVGRYDDEDGEEFLAAAARVPNLQWTVLVEQPTAEAFALTYELQQQLMAAIAVALVGTMVLGWALSNSIITRLAALTAATRALAEGRMDERVTIGGRDEIRQLGDSFNAMADRLVELQENVRRQERQAMFGKIAAGLVHDLSHPIQNIGNSCKLIVKMFDDLEYRETFQRTVEREMVIVKRVLEGLRNIARPMPLEKFPIEINRSVRETLESMQPHAEAAGVVLRGELSEEPLVIEADAFALARVYNNLVLNAIQATGPAGIVLVETARADGNVQVRVRDTGCGIPPDRLAAIFDDFVTTKRRGLGLGLAISRKIVEQLGGKISVASEVGRGTTFVLDFPRTRARPMLVAG